jgi:hypothetical protein
LYGDRCADVVLTVFSCESIIKGKEYMMILEYVSKTEVDHKVQVSFVGDIAEWAPLGGGFVYKASRESFLARYRPCVASDFGMRPMMWEVERGNRYQGFTNGRRWNGWEQPWVTREVLESFIADHSGCFLSATFEGDVLTLLINDGLDEEIVLNPTNKLYHLDFGWCIEESKEEGE